MYLRSRIPQPPATCTLICIHGLGHDGSVFEEVLKDPRFSTCNIFAPDLSGFGKGERAGGYSLSGCQDEVASLVCEVFKGHHTPGTPLIVVAHSFAGDVVTLLLHNDPTLPITHFVSVEGNLTPHDLFISGLAARAHQENRFTVWFKEDFIQLLVKKNWGAQYRSCLNYAQALECCDENAFLHLALEIYHLNTSGSASYKSIIGERFVDLTIPKVFWFGDKSLSPETRKFLDEHKIDYLIFPGCFHWPMLDDCESFNRELFKITKLPISGV